MRSGRNPLAEVARCRRVWRGRIRLGLLFLVSVLATPVALAQAAAGGLDAGTSGREPVSLTEYFAVLEDPGQALVLSDMEDSDTASRFRGDQASAMALSFGLTRSAYWLRLRLKNTGDRPVERMLEIANPLLVSIEFHQARPEGGYQSVVTGNALPFSTRAYPNRGFVFPLILPAHSDQIHYLRFQSTSTLGIPARLWEPHAFRAHERIDYIAQAWYFGMATAMILFNLLLFLALRDVTQLLLVGFITSSAFTFVALNGLGREFLWQEASHWPEFSHYVALSVGVVFLLAFTRRMLEMKQYMPRLDQVFKFLTATFLLSTLGLAASMQTFARPALAMYLANNIFLLGVGLYCAYKRQRSAYFFLAAFVVALVGASVNNLKATGLIPTNIVTVNAMQFGSALVMIVLAIALADRFNQLRRQMEGAQRQALLAQNEKLLAEQQVVEALRSSERLLEARVNKRTEELSATVDRLKQTQDELVQAEKLASLGSLVAGVAHELNTPIGTALTTASALEYAAQDFRQTVADGGLKRSSLEGFLQRSVDMAALLVRSCHRAASLVSSFKQVAVDQTSELQRPFDLLALVEDNLASLRPSLKHVAWTIEVEVPPGIRCDSYPGPLGQVLTNLVQNAAAHAFDGDSTGTLRVSATRVAETVELIVADNGKGMSADTLARIFDPFFTTRLGQGGSGLGLAICRNIVTGVLGGSLQASSQLAAGTRFVARFPCVAPRQERAGLGAGQSA